MGLDELTESARTDFEEWDDEDLDELRDKLGEYLERIEGLSKVMTNMDGRMEDIRDDMKQVRMRLKVLEAATDVDGEEYEVVKKEKLERLRDDGGSLDFNEQGESKDDSQEQDDGSDYSWKS